MKRYGVRPSVRLSVCLSVPSIDRCSSVRRAGSMKRYGVLPSVCLSVCPVYRQLQQCAAGCCCGPVGRATSVDSGAAGRRRSTAHSSKCEQCHVVSRRRKPNTDLLDHRLGFGAQCYRSRHLANADEKSFSEKQRPKLNSEHRSLESR